MKNAYLLKGISGSFINLGYLIETSAHFRNSAVEKFDTRTDFYNAISNRFKLSEREVVYLEFGVFQGESFGYWLGENKNPNSSFFGFDTFEGLPEDWGHMTKGHFSTQGRMPSFSDSRYQFYKGLFQDTLAPFLAEHSEKLKNSRLVVNMDADLYSSTLYVLTRLNPLLKAGDILFFDEFYSVGKASTEFRAFLDFLSISSLQFKTIAKTETQVCVEVF